MTDKNFDENQNPESAEVRSEGSDAQASGPEPQNQDSREAMAAEGSDETPVDGAPDDLTVEDILGATQTGEAAAEDAVLADLESTLLNDLKRLQAEWKTARAAQHGDLVEGTPFAVIADKVRAVVDRLGVVSYGEAGEEFDPQRHEAIFQQPTPGATKTTVLEVVEVGYRLGDVELRPAKVVVAVPAE